MLRSRTLSAVAQTFLALDRRDPREAREPSGPSQLLWLLTERLAAPSVRVAVSGGEWERGPVVLMSGRIRILPRVTMEPTPWNQKP